MSERDEESSLLHSSREEDDTTKIRHQPEALHRLRNYLKSSTAVATNLPLPLYHQRENQQTDPKPNKRNKTMDRHENWQSEEQQEVGKRNRRSLAKKVKATVVRPARAVGRRVFKNRYSSKVGVARQDGFDQYANDVIVSHKDTSPNQDESRNIHTGKTSLLRRSLSRMMSGGSVSRAGSTTQKKNRLDNQSSIIAGQSRENADLPVRSVEAITRNAALLCGAYAMGASHPEYSKVVFRLLEFIMTAWLTCLLILGLGWLRKMSNSPEEQEQHQELQEEEEENKFALGFIDYQKQWQPRESDPEMMPLVQHQDRDEPRTTYGTSTTVDLDTRAIFKTNSDENKLSLGTTHTAINTENTSTESVQAESSSSFDEAEASFSKKQQEQEKHQPAEHPSLSSIYVVDAFTGERILCNSSTPYRISNEWVEMDMLAMIRTPDADDENAVRGSAYNDEVSEHFRSRARRFEFQYQVKLKKKPVGKQLYFSCELDEPIKMGIVTKAFVSAAMAFVKSSNPNFHYNITGSKNRTSDGKYETAHSSFTVEGSLDRFVVTKPGEIPPKLGGDINEDPESIKRRKGGELTDWNTEDTYTMSIWSSYVDFLLWRVQKVPGIKPFGLASVIGTQPINLTMYLIDANLEGGTHYRKDIDEVIKLELSNGEQVGVGKEAKKWIKANSQGQQHSISMDSVEFDEQNIKHPALGLSETMDEMDEMDKDTADAAELGEGIYLRSGDSVLLREFLLEDEKSTACTVVNGGGFAVLSKRNVPVIIEKSKRSQKNKLIKSGDTVMFKMIQNKTGTDEIETRYLTIHRGWWLKWVTSMPSKNGHFTILTHEMELSEKALPTDETQSSFLTLGGSFSLRHKRWSRYAVGVSAEPSTDFGGRMLSLYNSKRNNKGSLVEEERLQTAYQSEDDGEMDKEILSIGEVGWIKPLVLCAQDPQGLICTSPKSPTNTFLFDDSKIEPQTPNGLKLTFSSDHSRADVPAWIELMDREQRVRQLAYVVRIVHRDPTTNKTKGEEAFTRLKCGKNLARIMSIGKSMKIKHIYPKPISTVGSSSDFASDAIVKSSSCPSLMTDAIANRNGMTEKEDKGSCITPSGDQDEGILMKLSASSDCLDMHELYEDPSNSIEVDGYGGQITSSKFDTDGSTQYGRSIDGDDSMSDSSSSSSDTENRSQRKRSMRKLKSLGKKTAKSKYVCMFAVLKHYGVQ